MLAARELMVGHLTASYLRLKPSSRFYTCMPLYHGAAHGLCITPTIHAGCTVVLGRKFSHRTFWPEVVASRADIIQYVGELCRYLLNGPPSSLDRAHNVKMAWGNGMRPDVWEPFRQRFNIPIINELYAATDGLGATFNENRGPFTRHAIGLRGLIWEWRNGGNEARVKMDVDTEEIMRDERGFAVRAKVGEPGQVLHRLDPAMLGTAPAYYKNEGASVGRRIKDVFEKGDLYFPQIAEVNVYGVQIPHTDGRAGAACFVMVEGLSIEEFDFKALAKHALDRLPRYAVPIFLRVSGALEYTGTLKIQKGRLKMEGVDMEKAEVVGGGDRFWWLEPGGEEYVPFGKKEWESLKNGSVKL
ncbi:acetyl-CoA synthetase-like protein [Lepidopterella palustris CBS 459.81]|uniref:Acetyl-CoA synthetase-like protein n=1 Tax=Lepidopterella palustris CBS 459.81 TaxID=1314670 RepID=A0A8E2E9E7_9PEZI|nr:acetyl-CoA synthetase-like protein [Lepidopterella palustris CBS 459.81]